MTPTYTVDFKQATIAQVQAGSTVVDVAAVTGVHERTIRKWLHALAEGKSLKAGRPGPKTFLPKAAEDHLYDWVVGRQLIGHPVERAVIIRKAQEVGLLGCGERVGHGWYKGFKKRYPALTVRSAQSLATKRNFVVHGDLTTLFNTLAKLIIELKLDSSRVFNMDETAFQKQLKSKKVVAVRGSSNVWSTEPTANFHLTIVACGSAAGFVIPPAFVLPGKTVSPGLLENCEAKGAVVTTSASGFMNTTLFERWLKFFASAVPDSIARPLVLILDGCGSHYSEEVLAAAECLNVMLVFLPPNATHLLQPLDVAVFATLKSKIQTLLGELVEEDENGYYNISKDDAIQVASMAWRGARIDRNVKAGFKACGLFPLSLVKMGARLSNFTRNGAPRHVLLATWLHMKALVEDEILTMPTPPSKARGQKRKRVSVGGRLLTHEVLQEIEAFTARSGAKGRKHASTSSSRAKPCKKTTSMSPSVDTGSDIVGSTVV